MQITNILYYADKTIEIGLPNQRSRIRHIDITFDGNNIIVQPGGISVVGTAVRNNGQIIITNPTVHIIINGSTVTLSFSDDGVQYNGLLDGYYLLNIVGSLVFGDNGNTEDQSITFFSYFGDTDGDGKVTNIDLSIMQNAVNTVKTMPNYRSYLDYADRGLITSADYNQFLARYKTQLNPDGTITVITP